MIDREKCKVEVYDFTPFKNDLYSGFVLEWEGNIGFGEYTIYKTEEGWSADSECMDSNDDKWFIKKLMESFIDKLKVEE